MNAVERAKADIQDGQHWKARQRLRSYLTTTGYDPDLLALMGRTAHEMRDDFDAGRMWLLSNETGPHVEQAINVFVHHSGKTPKQVVDNLPKAARLATIEQYPQMVRERLRRYGLQEAIPLSPTERVEPKGLSKVSEFILVFLFFVCLIAGIVVFGVGITAITRGKFDLVFN